MLRRREAKVTELICIRRQLTECLTEIALKEQTADRLFIFAMIYEML